jgi:hypothetical protein
MIGTRAARRSAFIWAAIAPAACSSKKFFS